MLRINMIRFPQRVSIGEVGPGAMGGTIELI